MADADREAVLGVVRGRYPCLTSEVGFQLAGPAEPYRWQTKYRQRAYLTLKALEADGLVISEKRGVAFYWYPNPLPDDATINLETGPFPFTPDWCIAPAATLQEWMDDAGMSSRVLATACAGRTGRDSALEGIEQVLGRCPLTDAHAAMLERGTFVPARFWLALEHNYRAGLAAGLKDATDG